MRYGLLLFATMACSESELGNLKDLNESMGMDIEVSPAALDFGLLSYEDPASLRTFTISSVGVDPATVTSIEIQGEEATSFTLLMPFEETVLDPGESIDVQVAFQPMNSDMLFAEAVVFSDDPDESAIPVSLVGQGAAPNLYITPNPLNFGATYVGCDMPNEITLSNIGQEDLVIYNIGGLAEPFLSDTMPAFPMTLAPEESYTIYVDFVPLLEGQYTDALEVASNDPDGAQSVDFSGMGRYVASYQQQWSNPVNPPSDIIFAVDQSCSMGDDKTLLASSFSTFISQLNNYSTDWQIIVANQDSGCNTSGILTPMVSSYQTSFQSAVMSGGGSYTEALLTPTRNAVENTDPGECNAGFMRPNAMLHIIMVSDEPEQSGGNYSDFVNAIITKKGNPSNVRLSSIYNPGHHNGRYVGAANDTGGLLFDITDNTWADANNLQLIAEASVIADKYDLDQPAVESTVEVYVNGYFVQGNWYYDSSQQAVFFDSNPPGEGDSIEIHYSAIAECE
jgi:hypothetical protein